MLVTVATFQPPMSPYIVVAVVEFVVQFDTAELMLPSVMGVSRATAMGESSSSAATAQTDEAAATCIAHRMGPRFAGSSHFPYAPGERIKRRGVGPHLGRLANAEMAGGEARGGHRGRDESEFKV
jgi:hypothetical protein